MFAKTFAEAVGLVFGLLLVASSSATVWYLADAVEQEKGWYWNHKPIWYLLTGAAAEGLVVPVWLLFICCCCGGTWSQNKFCPDQAQIRNSSWGKGLQGVVVERARIIRNAREAACPVYCSLYDNRLHKSSAMYTNILLIGLVVFCAAGLTGARAAVNAVSTIHYSSGLAAQGQTFSYVWYSASAACATAALFSYAVSSVCKLIMMLDVHCQNHHKGNAAA